MRTLQTAVLRLGVTAFTITMAAGVGEAFGKKDGVVQSISHGEIDWGERAITATGSGAPNLDAANAAAARLGAERSAKMDAFRNLLEAVKGVRVAAGATAGAMMKTDKQLRTQIEGAVRNFEVLDTKYYSDGGVDVVVRVPLDDVVGDALLADAGSKAAKADEASGDVTGIIINAKGIDIAPALAPKVVDPSGKPVYSAAFATDDAVAEHGVVEYAKSIAAARKSKRVSGNPILIKAMERAADSETDVVVSKKDAAKLSQHAALLAAARVIVVVD